MTKIIKLFQDVRAVDLKPLDAVRYSHGVTATIISNESSGKTGERKVKWEHNKRVGVKVSVVPNDHIYPFVDREVEEEDEES